MRLFACALLVSLVTLALSACDGPRGRAPDYGWTGTVDTLESGRVVVVNSDLPMWSDSQAWTLQERFRLGSLDSGGPDMFGDVRDLELGVEGEVYVLDAQAAEVRVFAADGSYRLTLGRSGEGPGELGRPAGMAVDSQGMVWVMNWGNARYTAFDPRTGDLYRETRRLASFASVPWPGRFTETGRLLDVGVGQDGKPAILRLDTAFVPSDTMGLPEPSDESRIAFRRDGLMVMSAVEPFAPQPAWAPRPRGGIIVGEGDRYRLHRVDFNGDTTMTIELLREPQRVSAAERDSALAVFAEMASYAAGAVPDRQPRVRDTKPVHGALFVDDQDRVWVRATPVSGRAPAWDVIAEDGRFLGQVPLPLPPSLSSPSVRGNYLALVSHVHEVPTVVVYEIVRGRP